MGLSFNNGPPGIEQLSFSGCPPILSINMREGQGGNLGEAIIQPPPSPPVWSQDLGNFWSQDLELVELI